MSGALLILVVLDFCNNKIFGAQGVQSQLSGEDALDEQLYCILASDSELFENQIEREIRGCTDAG